MKSLSCLGLALFTSLMAPAVLAAVPAPDTCRVRSATLLSALQRADYAAATAHFDARMRAALDADKLAAVWAQALPAQVGAFQRAAAATEQTADGQTIVVTPLEFARGWLDLQVSCGTAGEVDGLYFRPGHAPAAAPTPATGTQTTTAANHIDRDLAVASPFGPLPGTLTLPRGHGPFAAVLLVAGSGPEDRNETIGPNQPLRDIADALAARGIVSYRYDKRSFVYAAKMAANAQLTVDDEVTDDAVAALKLLAQQPQVEARHVFVLGHSLGALMVPRIASRVPSLAGAILLAAPTHLGIDTIVRQLRYIGEVQHASEAQIDAQVAPWLAAEKQLAKADAAAPPTGLIDHVPASYWLSLRAYDAIATAEKLTQPLLILQGEGDYQVTPHGDFAAWQKAFAGNTRVTTKSFAGLSHLFMPAGNPPSPADYQHAGHVATAVTTTIANWIEAHAKS